MTEPRGKIMVLDEATVLEIITENFEKEIELEAAVGVMEMDSYDLEDCFDNSVDYADLDGIDEIEVEEVFVEEEEDTTIVSGTLTALVMFSGYVHWDGEEVLIGDADKYMQFTFSFEVKDDKYVDFEVECDM